MEIKGPYIFRNSGKCIYNSIPIFMSGTFTLLISAHRYIKVIHSEYHERTVTNKLLTF